MCVVPAQLFLRLGPGMLGFIAGTSKPTRRRQSLPAIALSCSQLPALDLLSRDLVSFRGLI
eukprot:2482137-Rhodomonas_salina.1